MAENVNQTFKKKIEQNVDYQIKIEYMTMEKPHT
jgi:hypothetical protein